MRSAGLCALFVALSLAQSIGWAKQIPERSGQPTGRGAEQKSKGVIVQQEGDSFTFLVFVDGKTEKKTLRATVGTTAKGLESGWKRTFPTGASELAKYDLEGKTAEVSYRGGTIMNVVMQTACNNDFCPVKDCVKKCGAKPCICPAK